MAFGMCQPKLHGRGHQRRHIDLLPGDQVETGGGLGAGGHDHATACMKDAQNAGRTEGEVMRRRQRAQEARLRGQAANLGAGADAVVVIVMGARDQFRGAGAAAGQLEESHLGRGGRGRRLRGFAGLGKPVLQRLAAQDHLCGAVSVRIQCGQKAVIGEQLVPAVADQKRGAQLVDIAGHLQRAVAEDGIHGRDAGAQQGVEDDDELGAVGQLDHRPVAGAEALTPQPVSHGSGLIGDLAIAEHAVAIDHGNRLRAGGGLHVQCARQGLVDPIAARAVMCGQFGREAGEFNRHVILKAVLRNLAGTA